MKKSIQTLILLFTLHSFVYGQAVLPTTWGFSTTVMPNGWTQSGTSFYTSSGQIPPACKFDNTGDKVTINFASAPGALTYYLAGNSFAGGTFLVEESVDGVTYTTLHTHTNPPPATYSLFTDAPSSASRYIRFNYSNKVSGNIGLDEVTIAAGAAGPPQEINVVKGISTFINGSSYFWSAPVSTLSTDTFTIANLGTVDTLFISSITITGTDAADFVITNTPDTILAVTNDNLIINFTPSAAGNRYATITINSNDADEAAYVINVIGIGGSFASEPTAQPTALTFTNVTSYRFKGSFTPATGNTDGYLVLRKKGSAITDLPADGVEYQRGDDLGDSKVVFSGNYTSFNPLNIVASTDYYFAVFAFNGPATFRNYLTTSPLTGMVSSASTMMPANYYSTINTSNATFVTDLHNKINPHTQQFYSNYGPKLVSLFAARDTAGDQRVITCVYSGENQVYTEPFDWTTVGYSREHTYCHDWMPTNPASGLPEYDDYHHLFPTNQNQANVIRLNYPLGEVVNATYTYLGCKFGTNAAGNKVFEPRDDHKGDAARALMYEATCYNGVSGNNWSFPSNISTSIPYGQDQNVIKKWNSMDPPSKWEISRNDFIDSLQNNRNPFVDHPEYACFIDFSTMNYIANPTVPCDALGINKITGFSNVYVAPNPVSEQVSVYINSALKQNAQIEIIDMTGKIVALESVTIQTGANKIDLATDKLSRGIYTLKIAGENQLITQKLVKQ